MSNPPDVPLILPDLELQAVEYRVTAWLVPASSRVRRGQRVVEVTAGEVVVDLVAPTSGWLAWRVEEDEPIESGSVLARITPSDG